MARDPWDPERYAQFRDERARPFHDLVDMLPERPFETILDLGCGTGALTETLAARAGARLVIGLDRSHSMLREAPEAEQRKVRLLRADLRALPLSGQVDLLFSNAALHWIEDHPQLLMSLRERVRPGGWIAVQVPANHDHPAHRLSEELAGEEPFRSALGGWVRRSPVLAPEDYARTLDSSGFDRVEVVLRVYGQRVASTDDIVRWVSGTLLTAYESRLPGALYDPFRQRYAERLAASELGRRRPLYYSFKRILFVARRVEPGAPDR